MIKYYTDLKKIFDYLPKSIAQGSSGSSQLVPSGLGTCQPTSVEQAVARVFCEEDEKDVLEVARENGGGFFVDLLWASGLANEMLKSGNNYKLLVPPNSVFKSLPMSMRRKMRDNCFLRELLSYHISKKPKATTLIMSSSKHLTSELQGKRIFYTELDGKAAYGGSPILKADLEAMNGDVTIIDKFMVVPTQSVASILASSKDHKVLASAFQQADLINELKGMGPFTVFATKNGVSSNARDFIVEGAYFSNILQDGAEITANTLSGNAMVIRKMGNTIIVNGDPVTQADIRGTDGVIHVISRRSSNAPGRFIPSTV